MPNLTGLWHHPDFLKLWAGQTLSALSSNVTDLALPLIAALVLHASAFEMGLLLTVATLPDLLLGLFAGVWADRVRRRPIMIAADASRALLLLSVPVAAVFDMMTIWQLYAVLFLTGACATFFDVANMSYLPSLVGREHLVSANSKLAASTSFARAVGPGLAGGLIQLLTAPIAIVADTLSLIVSAVLVFTMRSREPERASDGRHDSVWREIFAGLRTLYFDPILRSVVVSSVTYLFFSAMALSIFVLYATRSLGVAPGTLGLIFGLGGVGSVLGAALAMRTARRIGTGPAMIAANLVGGLFWLMVPLAGGLPSAAVPLLMLSRFGAQLAGSVFYIIQTSLRQVITPEEVLGRMNASYRFLTMGIAPVGFFLGGVLGNASGLGGTLVIGGVGTLLPVVWLFCSPVRALRAVDAQEHRPESVSHS
jgi:MFS family permease